MHNLLCHSSRLNYDVPVSCVFKFKHCLLFTYGPAAEKKDLRTYANSKDPDQPVHLCSLVRIFAVHLHTIGTLLKIWD